MMQRKMGEGGHVCPATGEEWCVACLRDARDAGRELAAVWSADRKVLEGEIGRLKTELDEWKRKVRELEGKIGHIPWGDKEASLAPLLDRIAALESELKAARAPYLVPGVGFMPPEKALKVMEEQRVEAQKRWDELGEALRSGRWADALEMVSLKVAEEGAAGMVSEAPAPGAGPGGPSAIAPGVISPEGLIDLGDGNFIARADYEKAVQEFLVKSSPYTAFCKGRSGCPGHRDGGRCLPEER